MIRTDYHLHTTLSVDAPGRIEDMVARAVGLGLTEIAITDHVDHNPADEGAGLYDPARGLEITRRVAEEFKDRITVRHGAELGEPHLYGRENAALYGLPYEVIIGSVHCMGPYGVHSDLYDHVEPDQAVRDFFRFTLDMVRDGDLDIVGHLDYFDRYAVRRGIPPYDPAGYEDLIRPILETILARDLTLEVNTSGYRSKAPRPFPHPQVLRWYYQMGGRRISLGSDAHQPDHIGLHFEAAVALLREIGFRKYLVFRQRTPIALPL